ncbi:MAG: ribonuclease Z [Chitinophagaceae bacterium]|nr:MAG: ribonuclease Z [Chitinophagaceae bacterium]
MIALAILGNNSAIPAFGRNPTSQVLQVVDENFLIDCGEGTQLKLSEYKIKRSRINHIFISHMHGDHYFGLIGLISSMALLGRTADLHIYAPAELQQIIELQLQAAHTTLPFSMHFYALGKEGHLCETKKMKIECFKVNHRIACWGFIFREKKNSRSIVPERVRAYEVPAAFYEALQQGADYSNKKGTIIPNEELTIAAPAAKSYAYCADTLYDESIAEKVKNVDLLYHETTYLQDLHVRARERFHSTTAQAAAIAKLSCARKLLIGHFSSKYEVLDEFLNETQAIFPNTELALEGTCYSI